MSFLDSLAARFNEPTTLEALRNREAVPGIGDSQTVISNLAPGAEARYAANVARRLGTQTAVSREPVTAGSSADPEARYTANVARRLGTVAAPSDEAAFGSSADPEVRYAANVARRLGRQVAVPIESSAMGSSAGGGSAMGSSADVGSSQMAASVAAAPGAPAPPVVTGPSIGAVQSAISNATHGYRPGVTPDYYGVTGPERIESPPPPVDPSQHPAVVKRKAMGPKGVVPGAVPGGVPTEIAGTPPPPSPELLDMVTEELPIIPENGKGGHTAREAATMQPTMPVAEPDFSTGSLPWRDPGFIRRQHGLRDESPPQVPQAGHGFLAHLKGLMEGLGAGMATGHPLAGAIMGVAGGVKPQLGANAWYNNVTLPRWQGQQDQALDRAAKRLAIDKDIAQITGRDPATGEPTYAAQQAEAKSDQQDRIAEALAAHRKQMEDISRQREQDMLEVRRGNLDLKQALKDEKIRTDGAMENLRKELLKIQQQNADANTMRANKVGQPRTTTTTKSLGPNPDHAAWEKEREAALAKNPGASVSDLVKGKQLRREPPATIQTGTRTTRRTATAPAGRLGSGTQSNAAGPSKTITREQYDKQVQKYSADPSTSTADGKAMVDAWMRKHGYEVSEK